MASPTLEIAASRLVERLRAAPSDAVVEHLEERTARVRELRAQGASDWASCRDAIEALIDDTVAKRQRIVQAGLDLLNGLEALVPSIETMAEQATGACAAARGSIQAPVPPLVALAERLETDVERWAGQAGGFIAGLVEARAQALVRAQETLARLIGTELRVDLQQRRDLFETWAGQAGELAGAATGALNAGYEHWAVRIAQVGELAERDGKDRVSAHAASAATSAVTEATAAHQDLVEGVRALLQAARTSLAALEWAMQSVPSQVEEALGPTLGAIDDVAKATAAASQEMQDSTVRLHVFASGSLT
jgi:hypothetical protein